MRSGRAFGDDTVGDFPSASRPKADEAGKEPEGREDGVLFIGGRTYSDDYQSGNGAYRRVMGGGRR